MNFKTLCNASFSLERERRNVVDARIEIDQIDLERVRVDCIRL